MQKKWVTVVAIVAIVSVTICLSGSDENTADTSDNLTTYYVNVGQAVPKQLDIIINENYFSKIDENHETVWSYATSTDPNVWSSISYTDFIMNVGGSSDYINDPTGMLSFKFEETSTVGYYKLDLKANNGDSSIICLFLRCSITINVLDGTEERDLQLENHYIKVSISLNGSSNLPSTIEYYDGTYYFPIEGIIPIVEGMPVVLTPILKDGSGNTIQNEGLVWYSYGLPRGMAMTKTGEIAGVPVDAMFDDTATLFVEDGYGRSATFTIKIYVSAHRDSGDVTYYLYNGLVDNTLTLRDLVYEPTQFMTQRDRTVTLAIDIDDEGLTVNSYKIAVVDLKNHTGAEKVTMTSRVTADLVYDQGSSNPTKLLLFTLPTDGTGVYRVSIQDSNGVELDTFDLYILAKVLAVESAVIVESAGSS